MQILWKFFYNLLWHFVLPFWFLAQIPALCKNPRQTWEAILERWTIYPSAQWQNQPVVWFHGSSLGEVVSLQPLMSQLKKRWGDSQILTISTSRGKFIAIEKKVAPIIHYAPLDIGYLVRRAIAKLQPQLLIVFETEIWPALFWECQKKNIPIIIVSGRISNRSFPRYRLAQFFFSSVLKHVHCLMQSQDDVQRICQIGASSDHVQHCGDIKLDGLKTQIAAEDQAFLQHHFPVSSPVIVAGSTHHKEEALLLDVYQQLRQNFPSLTLILAPRHLDRMPEIITLLENKQIAYVKRSQLPNAPLQNVVILDTYGELSKVYALADITIMGGTFVPVGGHNLMEAAALAKPVVFGPYTANCRQQARIVLEKNAGQQVQNAAELQAVLTHWLAHPEIARECGQRGQQAVLANQGSLARCMAQIETITGFTSK